MIQIVWSGKGFLVAVFTFGFSLFARRFCVSGNDTRAWTVALMSTAILRVIAGRQITRLTWTGAAIFGWVYLGIVFGPLKSGKATPIEAPSDLPQRLTATVRLAKERFLEGEPIGVVISINNPGPRLAYVQLNYPLMFTPGFSLIQFDGGEFLPALPIRMMGFSGALIRFDTEVPPGTTWSRNVFLQNHMRQPPPGVYQAKYRFQTAYLLGKPNAADNEVFGRGDASDYPLVKAEGTLTVHVTKPDPAALDRVLDGVVASLRKGANGEKPSAASKRQAIEALKAVDGPAVIPHVVKRSRRSIPMTSLASMIFSTFSHVLAIVGRRVN